MPIKRKLTVFRGPALLLAPTLAGGLALSGCSDDSALNAPAPAPTPSSATSLCSADQTAWANGVFSPSSRRNADALPTNLADTSAGWETVTISFGFTVAVAVAGSVPSSGQKAWPLQALSAAASGGIMLTVRKVGAAALIPSTASLQSPVAGEGVRTAARTWMYLVVSGSAGTRCVVFDVGVIGASARPSSESATRTW